MRAKILLCQCLMALLFLAGCKGKGVPALQVATGSPYEVLVVADRQVLNGEVGKEIREILGSDVPGLPQPESQFRVSTVTPQQFDNILKPVRNIFMVEITDLSTQPKFSFARDVWGKGQMILYLKAPDLKSLQSYLEEHKQMVLDFFVNSEMNRVVNVLRKDYNKTAAEELFKLLGVEMNIPMDMAQVNKSDNFFWISNNGRTARMDLVVYSVPYKDIDAFSPEKIIARRDSIMKLKIPGAYEGSYMTTSKFVYPEFRTLSLGGKYVGEMRGLWEVEGDVMGGAFVSHTRLDEANQRIITAEVFVYAPEKKKRNLLRKLEASLYTLKLPQDNLLPEVPVLVNK
ncbi:MAG: DUF4837 family protein [Bacteroidales bacterium]